MITCMRLTFFDGSGFDFFSNLSRSDYPALALLAFVYMLLTSVVLVNGLIGIFGSIFASQKDDNELVVQPISTDDLGKVCTKNEECLVELQRELHQEPEAVLMNLKSTESKGTERKEEEWWNGFHQNYHFSFAAHEERVELARAAWHLVAYGHRADHVEMRWSIFLILLLQGFLCGVDIVIIGLPWEDFYILRAQRYVVYIASALFLVLRLTVARKIHPSPFDEDTLRNKLNSGVRMLLILFSEGHIKTEGGFLVLALIFLHGGSDWNAIAALVRLFVVCLWSMLSACMHVHCAARVSSIQPAL
jgi:hypothetical protein